MRPSLTREASAAAEAVAGVARFPNLNAEQREKGFTDFNNWGSLNPEIVSRQLDEGLQGVREQRLRERSAMTACRNRSKPSMGIPAGFSCVLLHQWSYRTDKNDLGYALHRKRHV
jgi:hypothetical protein